MMRLFSILMTLFALAPWHPVQAQTTFMDLWCEYGGEGCVKGAKPAPRPAPAAAPAPAVVPQQAAPQRIQQRPIQQGSSLVSSKPLIPKIAKAQKRQGISFGRYYALVIGNNNYPHLPKLKSAVIDAQEISRTLKQHYGFAVTTLLNATRDDIIGALDEFRKNLTEKDNFLIYYAGHGWLDEASERGYWLPVDAQETTRSRWVSNADITDTLKALKAKHVMVVADSCYSGTLTRSITGIDGTRGLKLVEKPASYLETLVNRKSRTVLASGSLEPVSDSGGGQHSVFAHAFLKSLSENTAIMDGTQLFGQVRQQVLLNAPQTPQYHNIRFAGHDVGGDFVFLRQDL